MKNAVPKGVVSQVRIALKSENRLASLMGFLLGGIVPVTIFLLSHYEVRPGSLSQVLMQPTAWFVSGGLLFSAKTVFAWGKMAFDNAGKAVGFVILLEGAMVCSHIAQLTFVLLGYLICINGVATGCNLSLKK